MTAGKPQLFTMSEPPATLGRYELLGVLGRGGMASVYLGRSAGEAGFSRLVAIKVLHPHLSDDEDFVGMLFDEAQIAACLHHPNVVPIVDVGTHGELRYVVLEYVEGCSLSVLLRAYRETPQPHLIVPIVLDALAGLHAAHVLTDDEGRPMNLVHRDISPQNILVGVDGTARLTDFGVAKARTNSQATRPGSVKGKIGFLSPEQIRGAEVDHRSDLFSAGCLLWCMLTGRRLFRGDNDAATMKNILDMPIPAPSTVGFKPPPEFDVVCLRALERDPSQRWASAAEMEDALRKAALECKQLGSRREVSQWAMAAFGRELDTRRAAVRAAAARQPRSPPPVIGDHLVTSGIRSIPAVGMPEPEVDTGETTLRAGKPAAAASMARSLRVRQFALGGAACGLLGVVVLLRVGLTHWGPTPHVTQGALPAATPAALSTAAASEPKESAASALAATPSPNAPPPSAPPYLIEKRLSHAAPTEVATPAAATSAGAIAGSSASKTTRKAAPTEANPSGAHVNCDPPFVVDANGIEHFKPGCL